MKILTLFLASWLAGIAAYLGSLWLFYRQSIGSGDLRSVLLYSLLAYSLAFGCFYLPALFGLRRLLHGLRPLWAFPLVSVLLGIIPTAFIFYFWGGLTMRAFLSPEASLFYAMFVASGVVVGLGFAYIYRNKAVT